MAAPGGGIRGAVKFIWFPARAIVPYGNVPFTFPFCTPSVELQVALLLINQSTAMVPPPETVGVQTSDLPEAAVCDASKVTESTQVTALMTAGGRMVMLAVAVRLVCAWATAVMVTTPLLVVGTTAGAVYRPFASIVPTVELPLAMVLTCQFATVLLKFEMVAVH